MSGKILKTVLILLIQGIWISGFNLLTAQEAQSVKKLPVTRILFVLDASQSMSGTWESDLKINIARRILIDLVDSLQNVENIEMALRIYGHQSPVPPQDCNDTKLEVAFGKNTAPRIRQKLRFIMPKGTTPIAHSLSMATYDFPPCNNCRNIILLITDGIEACDGDPCAVSLELQKQGIILKPFVIGIGLDPGFKETFDCVGYYFNAQNEDKFRESLGMVISQVLNTTTTQVNLLDEKGLPTETNVNMTFFDRVSGKIKYNLIHTINHKGNPDTLFLDHLLTYRLRINTLPPIEVDSVSIVPGKHTIISIEAPQGYLIVKTPGNKPYEGKLFTVRKNGEMNTLSTQLFGEAEKYLIGKYDLEIPTVPRLYIDDVEILQSHTTSIEIPQPGNISFIGMTNGFGSIYQMQGGDQKWIYNLHPALRHQILLMQPGLYRVTFRQANTKSSNFTVVKDFEVKPGESLTVELL
jgi:Ca-activated chloride channel homolog